MYILCSACIYLLDLAYTFYDFFAFKKNKSDCMYNFDNAMWFARGEKSNGKGNM